MRRSVDLDKMSVAEKLQLIEVIWNDLCRNESAVPSPEWHGDVLEKRQRKIVLGEEKLIDWPTAKKILRDELK